MLPSQRESRRDQNRSAQGRDGEPDRAPPAAGQAYCVLRRSRARPSTVRVSPAATISVAMVIRSPDGEPVRGSSPLPSEMTEVDVVGGTMTVVGDTVAVVVAAAEPTV